MKLTKEQKALLIQRLKEGESSLQPTRVMGASPSSVTMDGCSLPAYFDGEDLHVWRKCSRSSGSYFSIDELVHMQNIVRAWYAEITASEGSANV